jgi:hypothetical protein
MFFHDYLIWVKHFYFFNVRLQSHVYGLSCWYIVRSVLFKVIKGV